MQSTVSNTPHDLKRSLCDFCLLSKWESVPELCALKMQMICPIMPTIQLMNVK